jgi:hypothetical protein
MGGDETNRDCAEGCKRGHDCERAEECRVAGLTPDFSLRGIPKRPPAGLVLVIRQASTETEFDAVFASLGQHRTPRRSFDRQ